MVSLKNSAGEVPQVEVLRAKVELAKASSLVKSSENKTRIARARLNTVLGRNSAEPIGIQGELKQPGIDFSLEEAETKALSARPELKRIEYSIHKTRTMEKQAYLNYLPNLDFGLSRHRLEGQKFWDFSLSFSIPLFFWQPKRGEIAEAEIVGRALEKENSIFKTLSLWKLKKPISRYCWHRSRLASSSGKFYPNRSRSMICFYTAFKRDRSAVWI